MLPDSETMVQFGLRQWQTIGDLLLQLGQAPPHPQRAAWLKQLLHAAHTLTDAARGGGFDAIEQVAQRVEDVLRAARQDRLRLTPDACDTLYATLKVVDVMVKMAEQGQTPRLESYQPLLTALDQLLSGAAPASPAIGEHAQSPGGLTPSTSEPIAPADETEQPDQPEEPVVVAQVEEPELVEVPEPDDGMVETPAPVKESTHAAPSASTVEKTAPGHSAVDEHPDAVSMTLPAELLDNLLAGTNMLMTCTIRDKQRARDAQAIADLSLRWGRVWRHLRPSVERLQECIVTPEGQPGETEDRTVADETHALLSGILEAHSLIGELENRLSIHAQQSAGDHDRLAEVSSRLHDQARRLRMQPVESLFRQLRLQIHETARAAGKPVLLEIDAGQAHADRQTLEQLREVLFHLLRYLVEYSSEPPELRAAHGKPLEGRLRLQAEVTGDHLVLSVSDDGPGLDLDGIRRRAEGLGLAPRAELERMPETDLIELMFMPGFTVMALASIENRRAVGLDAVRATVERMHGRVSAHSRPGEGTTFTISVPASPASTRGLIVSVGSSSYMVPLVQVERVIPVAGRDVIMNGGRAAVLVEGLAVPLVRLADLLGGSQTGDVQPATTGTLGVALVMAHGERRFAGFVDAVLDEQEVMVQQLPAPLERVRFVAGATIVADGSVILMLDVVDLARVALGSYPQPAPAVELPPLPAETVLIVAEAVTTRTLARGILEEAGYHVVVATGGEEALDVLVHLAQDGGCSLVVVDGNMSGLDGYKLTEQLRADSRFQYLPVLLVTEAGSQSERERGLAAGADAYIVKHSFDKDILLDTVAELM